MPRLISTLSRLLKLVTLSWLSLIGLWTFLPSPTIPPESNSPNNNAVYPGGHHEVIQETLISGKILHTIQRWSPSFSANSILYPVPGNSDQKHQLGHVNHPSDDCSSLLIDWRLAPDPVYGSRAALLELGRDLRARINLTDAISKVHVDDGVAYDPQNAEKVVYVSDQITVQVDAGDEDHIINMPWFHWADAALFHNQMHGFTYDVQLIVVARRDTGAVEIWKAAPLTEFLMGETLFRSGVITDLNFENMAPADRAKGLLASFENVYRHDMHYIRVADMQSSELPSKTYTLRSLILVPLAPSLTVAFFLLSEVFTPLLFPIIFPALLAYVGVVLIGWAYYQYQHHRRSSRNTATRYHYGSVGSPYEFESKMGFGEWCSRFWMTRHVCAVCCCCCGGGRSRRGRRANQRNSYHRYWAGEKSGRKVVIWGPAGPVYEE